MINKFFLSLVISILPFSSVRKYFYNKTLSYLIDKNTYLGSLVILQSENCNISNSKIKPFNVIKSRKIRITNSNIDKFNRIINLDCLSLYGCMFGTYNKVYGKKLINTKSKLSIDQNSIVENYNFFDLNDQIIIKKNCKIISHCNFWTHGFDGSRTIMIKGPIEILESVVIESCVTIISSIVIQKKSVVKFGSIVHKNLLETGVYSSNEIFKKI